MMRQLQSGFFSFGSLLTSTLIMVPLMYAPQFRAVAACAPGATGCEQTAKAACTTDNRNPFDLYADIQTPHKVQLSWDVCQKSAFYQVSWNFPGGAPTIVRVNDAANLNWTLTRVRDESKLIFKVRGCNDRPNADSDCTTWTELTVVTPDWD